MINTLIDLQMRVMMALEAEDSSALAASCETLQQLQSELAAKAIHGGLNSNVARVAASVANNTSTITSSVIRLHTLQDEIMETLGERLKGILMHHDIPTLAKRAAERKSPRRPRLTSPASAFLTTPPESPLPPSSSNPPPPSPPLLELQPADHLRLWFLDHLANPYPTITEKKELSLLTGIAKNKIDSDMTNWRRRAGWTDIKDTYADGDKVKMRRLMEAVEGGKETRAVVIEAVEKMRAYLERREEYGVGSWVYSLKKMAKEEQARKKPRVEGKSKAKADRAITPPPSAQVTPASSASSAGSSSKATLGTHNTSPAISLRSASSASSLGSTSSLPTFTNFKPYSFTPASLPFSATPLSAATIAEPTPPRSSLVPGVKRINEESRDDAPNTRQKLAPSPFSADSFPQWSTDNLPFSHPPSQLQPIPSAPAYVSSASLYPAPPMTQYAEPITWSASAPMPAHLPHMSTMPRTLPAFSIPQQHDFQFRPTLGGAMSDSWSE